LNYEAIKAAWDAGELGELPRLELEEQDARFVMEPIPRVEARGKRAARALGVYGPDEAMVIEAHAAIKAGIEKKAGRYGELAFPYVIAVNALSQFAGERHTVDALFGTEGFRSWRDADGEMVTEEVRNTNGVWNDGGRIRYTRINAVLSTDRLTAWRLAENPIAPHPQPRRPPSPNHFFSSF
jgi:hypothetical protein